MASLLSYGNIRLFIFTLLLCLTTLVSNVDATRQRSSESSSTLPTITSKTMINDIVEYYLKDKLNKFLPLEDVDEFYNAYNDEAYGLFDGLNLNSLLDMFDKSVADNQTCQQCIQLLTLAKALFKTEESLMFTISSLCKDSESSTKQTCIGLINRFVPPLFYLIQNTKLTFAQGCAVLVGHGCIQYLNITQGKNIVQWELPLPARRQPKSLLESHSKNETKNMKILHFSDVHLDLLYEAGSNATCNEPICCRSTSKDTKHLNHIAGHWGEVNGDCDASLNFAADTLDQIAHRHHDLDVIFWTGDNVAHSVWNTTIQDNLRHIQIMSVLMNETFQNVTIFPVLGNHETHPVNMYVLSQVEHSGVGNYSMRWLYETLADDYWAQWLPDEAQKRTFKHGGYYSKNISAYWKVVVLNSNIAQKNNYWILYDPVDPDGQLAWLINELDAAERAGQYVTIVGHVPMQSGVYDAWAHNYFRIIDRYQNVVLSSFCGHSHKDEILVLYNEKSEPISVQYISGSLTTYSYLNPQYTVFELDSYGNPIDSTVYLADLDSINAQYKSNNATRPVWREEYSPIKAYKLANMSPKAWSEFLARAEKPDQIDLAMLYAGHYHRYSKEYELGLTDVQRLIRDARRYSPFMKKFSSSTKTTSSPSW